MNRTQGSLVNVIGSGMIAGITSNFLLPLPLIDTHIIDHQLGRELQVFPILVLKVVRHSKVEYDVLHDRAGKRE